MPTDDYRRQRDNVGGDENYDRRGYRLGSDYYGNRPEHYGVTQWGDPYRSPSQAAGNEIEYGGSSAQFGRPAVPSYRGRGPREYRRSDERIRDDVCQCLTDDERVDASNIEVSVQDGEVILSGSVTSRNEKRWAEQAIDQVSGIIDVHNRLRIVDQQRDENPETAPRSGS